MRLLALACVTCIMAVAVLSEPVSAQDWNARCAAVPERTDVGVLRPSPSLDSLAWRVVPRWVPHLTIIRAVGLEDGVPVPDPQADSLHRELREWARRDSTGFRDLMLATLRAGRQRSIPELAANEAAVWYRHEDGRAGPVLAALAGASSDTWLLPLSAINSTLSVAEEDVVARIACDVALPLIAARAAAAVSAGFESRLHLEWVDHTERILRHAERLVQGSRRALIEELVARLQPSAPRLDPKLFNSRP